jgi:hypothetical protein
MHNRMIKMLAFFLVGFGALLCVSFVANAAPEPCKGCDAVTGLTVREQIKVDRAREADRIAKESTVRPWDGKDIGQVKQLNSLPVVR